MVRIDLYANRTLEQRQFAQLPDADPAELCGPDYDQLECANGGLEL
jgi:hypothetical protein